MQRIDASDGWATPLLPRDGRDPLDWARQILGRESRWLRVAMRARALFAGLLGLDMLPKERFDTGFPVLRRSPDEVLCGLDDRHLNFRVGVRVTEHQVSVTTTVQLNNRIGRVYWSVVRLVHPTVVRRMLARAPFPTTGQIDRAI